MTGVPSIASRPLTCTRTPSMPRTRTRCKPMGLGRLGALVLKTPASGRLMIAARMDPQHGPVGLVQPAQHDDLLADRDAVQARLNLGIQDQVRVRCAFIPLPRRISCRDE